LITSLLIREHEAKGRISLPKFWGRRFPRLMLVYGMCAAFLTTVILVVRRGWLKSSEGGTPMRPAVFLDRDGTVIAHVHYLSDPADVRLLPGAAEALAKLRAAGFACVLVTNQSGIGRGMYTEERLRQVHAEMTRQLAIFGVSLDGIYFCPEAPVGEGDDPTVIDHPDRKPGPGMLMRAARELGLDLSASWMIGDMISDVLAGINAGCLGSILVRTGKRLPEPGDYPGVVYQTADDLRAAAALILEETPGRKGMTTAG